MWGVVELDILTVMSQVPWQNPQAREGGTIPAAGPSETKHRARWTVDLGPS